MTDTDELITTVDGGVARLTINRPERMNALSARITDKIRTTLQEWAGRDDLRTVVLTGAGGSFSTGADITDIAANSGGGASAISEEGAATIISRGSDLARAVRAIPVPVIAAVDGAAVGIGASMALGADLVYATSRAYFLFPFVNIGLMPDGGASMLIAASIGRARANALLMLGEKFRAPAAFNAGLVTEVLDDEPALQARVEEVVAKLAAKSSSALRTTKAAADAITMAAFEPALALELAGQTRLLQSVEFQQTLAAFAKPQA
ncbi:MAG TPA: enoyl-CoA hydratase-related protein [Gordonia sp. (in: high G+C Gram-positive bacteria)]|uniref:enoyl-CoA hydratase-related protein n=1 Tax=unclassified Gordonia (in: high G+C Gram-positive bacteria) TaxID=2657482 RepID=UPI000F9F1943|nr:MULTISPECIES: enoyl-CoA hydratase-related protein [unclassified Gordonia (in: high G+C Gram-positive bacteria)]RUP41550.1 MAG: enoyl-CoA hydratase [Gordonia sp. (in: high G+C Gram-positive bacteria)]HNP56638.1 enoyl-CoA hydratase-related protein [Gordonia sp. (in: high G+C Gram-positive bacteria)]HRC50308.1 enoyl-CoA hydratase-related protein [Gordonia sp. (in: high G+C Gram-positive bacteria)]